MVDWIQMLKNVSNSLVGVEQMLLGFFKITGACFVISGLFGLIHFGSQMHGDPEERKKALLKILIGMLLIEFARYTIPILLNTLYGSVNTSDFGTFTKRLDLFFAVKRIIQLAGVIWIGLGIKSLVREEEGQKSKSFKAVTYIFAGVLALNYEYASRVLAYLFNLVMQIFK